MKRIKFLITGNVNFHSFYEKISSNGRLLYNSLLYKIFLKLLLELQLPEMAAFAEM